MAERSESGFPEWVGNHYPVSGIRYPVSGIWYLVSGIWYLGKTFRDWRTREVANRFGR